MNKTAAAMACCVMALFQPACAPPGEGEKALAGFKASTAIIQALGEYRGKSGAYPAKIELLVPEFLTRAQLIPPSGVYEYGYQLKGSEFLFNFAYHGPGSNHCYFESSARSWSCEGHY